jgi:hypothetical protein
MAYFANAVEDTISVNINNALLPIELSPRPSLGSSGAKSIEMAVASFNIKANKDKGQFGIDSTNRVTIQFGRLRSDPNQFDVTVSNLAGQNLYFYVFENTLVGQNEQGSSLGIKIEMLQVVLKPIQGPGAA